MSETLLRVEKLNYSYRAGDEEFRVLKEVSFEINKGDFVGIVGASGSGKSTLFYVLGGLLRPNSGALQVDGVELYSLNDDRLAQFRNQRIGFIFQQFHLLSRTKLSENILLPARYPCELSEPTAADRARVKMLAEKLGISDQLSKMPNQISGGQQQRVAIARALMRDVDLILADEPTGNLDSQNSKLTMELLKELNSQGKTIVLITHDREVARYCHTILEMKDGVLTHSSGLRQRASDSAPATPADGAGTTGGDLPPAPTTDFSQVTGDHAAFQQANALRFKNYAKIFRAVFPLAFDNLRRNRLQSLLTMLGVVIGVSAVFSMVTLGQYTKIKILEGYEALGINTISIHGYPNWTRKATDAVGVNFRAFEWEKDLVPLRRLFPSIDKISPVLMSWSTTVYFGGIQATDDVRAMGVGEDYFAITNRKMLLGSPFRAFHIDNRSSVCLIGYELARKLFNQRNPIGELLSIAAGENYSYPCRVLGVFKPQSSPNEWFKPDWQVIMPFTYFAAMNERWASEIHDFASQLKKGAEVSDEAERIKNFFGKRYGKAGTFKVDSDMTLIAQARRFLNLFTLLLASIALLSLIVGGIGINNMMLVSVNERIKEIGLRKALGATHRSVRFQILTESVLLCVVAGLLGVLIGFASYEGLMFAASKFISKVKFEWIIEPAALSLSFFSIVLVGILSGFVPALKAEKLEVIEALRSE